MANMQKFCPKGHAYDSSLPACPYCLPNSGGIGPTAPANNPYAGNYPNSGIGPTAPANNQYGAGNYSNSGIGPTAPVQQETTFIGDLSIQTNSTSNQQTMPIHVRPVVGWLVCVQGPDVGKDFSDCTLILIALDAQNIKTFALAMKPFQGNISLLLMIR